MRQLLYLDHQLVRDFLAQSEGGVFDETRQRTTTEGKGGLSGQVGVGPVTAGGERSKTTQAESEYVLKQTAASEFDRLYAYLEQEGLPVYDAIDTSPEELPIRRKDIVEVDARIRLSGVQALIDMFGTFGRLAPLLDKVGVEGLDPEMVEGMQAVAMMSGTDQPVPVIATVPGETGLQVALELRRAGVLTDEWDTEATVLFKVQRLLRKGDRQLVGDPFGGLLKLMPEAERQEAVAKLKTEDLAKSGIGEAEISYPGIIGTPIAIYR